MHRKYHFIVMLSQVLLHNWAHQHYHQGAHTILTSYLYDSVHYRKIYKIKVNKSDITIF
jgi:hypothetical protein